MLQALWRNGRVVEGTCLENKQGESSRGFKSYFLRQMLNPPLMGGFSFLYWIRFARAVQPLRTAQRLSCIGASGGAARFSPIERIIRVFGRDKRPSLRPALFLGHCLCYWASFRLPGYKERRARRRGPSARPAPAYGGNMESETGPCAGGGRRVIYNLAA